MAGGALWVAHIVQAIEEGHEIVIRAGKRFRGRNFKTDPARYPFPVRRLSRQIYGSGVIVESKEFGLRIRLRHQNRRCSEAAPNIGDFRSAA